MIGHSTVTTPEGVAEERPSLTVTATPRKYMGALIWIEWMEMPGISLLLSRCVAVMGKSRSSPACGIWAGDQFAATLHCTPTVPSQVRRVRGVVKDWMLPKAIPRWFEATARKK